MFKIIFQFYCNLLFKIQFSRKCFQNKICSFSMPCRFGIFEVGVFRALSHIWGEIFLRMRLITQICDPQMLFPQICYTTQKHFLRCCLTFILLLSSKFAYQKFSFIWLINRFSKKTWNIYDHHVGFEAYL